MVDVDEHHDRDVLLHELLEVVGPLVHLVHASRLPLSQVFGRQAGFVDLEDALEGLVHQMEEVHVRLQLEHERQDDVLDDVLV